MAITVRVGTANDLRRVLETGMTSFGWHTTDEHFARFSRYTDPRRTFGAYDGETMVGTAADLEFRLTVPGGKLTAAGVTLVGVVPSHRRRGVLTSLMHAQLDDIRARGEPLAILWASEGDIYPRFGYGIATACTSITADRDRARFRNDPGPSGRVRLVDVEKAIDELGDVYERVCTVTPGMYERSRVWWEAHTLADPEDDREGGSRLFRAVWEDDDGRAQAYAIYRVHEDWDGTPKSRIEVRESMGTNRVAIREIWRFLFGVDLIAFINAHEQPALSPLFFMVSEPRRLRARLADGLYVRLVDLAAALEGRRYQTEDSLVFDVSDEFIPANAGRWRLTTTSSGARVERTTDEPDLALTVADLGAAYLGGFSFSELANGGTIVEHTPGALATTDLMFSSEQPPWCPENF